MAVAPSAPLNPTFARMLDDALPSSGDAVDLGTGAGRVALAVAPRVRSVVGIDIDAGSLDAARLFARQRNLTNVRFVQDDAERGDLRTHNAGQPYLLATAYLFLSIEAIARVAQALAPGGRFVAYALEESHWREAGGSRFNLGTGAVRAALERHGLRVLETKVETDPRAFEDAAAAQAYLKDRRLFAKWKADGRWAAWSMRLRRGERTLTESHLVFSAERPQA